MFRHVVMFRWNDRVTDGAIEAMGVALDALVATLPAVVEYRHGGDLGLAEGNFDYVIVAEFATVDDFVAYRDDPEHQRIITELIKPFVESRAAVQYDAS